MLNFKAIFARLARRRAPASTPTIRPVYSDCGGEILEHMVDPDRATGFVAHHDGRVVRRCGSALPHSPN